MSGNVAQSRKCAQNQRVAVTEDVGEGQPGDIDHVLRRRKPGFPEWQQIGPACKIGCAAPAACRDSVIEFCGTDVPE
jgi:hypothetical protein